MDAKLFKNVTPYINQGAVTRAYREDDFAGLGDYPAEDPSPTSWSSIGFVPLDGENYIIDTQGAGFVAVAELADRILPGSVQKEKIKARADDIEARDGRKIGKKQYAEIRDDVILELLPMALIRRKRVPILFTQGRMLVFATSAKVCDDVMLLIRRGMGDKHMDAFQPQQIMNLVENNITGTMTTMAKESGTPYEDGDDQIDFFENDTSVLMKGENKQAIRVKDKDVDSDDVQELLKGDYSVGQLGLKFIEAGSTDPTMTFVLTDKLILRSITLLGIKNVSEKDEKNAADTFLATAWLTARSVNDCLDLVIKTMGGLKNGSRQSESKEVVEDDDEL